MLSTAARASHIISLAWKHLVVLHLREKTNTHKWPTGYYSLWSLILSLTSSPIPPLRQSTPNILASILSWNTQVHTHHRAWNLLFSLLGTLFIHISPWLILQVP